MFYRIGPRSYRLGQVRKIPQGKKFVPLQGRSRDSATTSFGSNPGANCYKTFYGCRLRIFVISQSICPWQAFPAQFNVCGLSQPYLQTLDQARKVCQGQTLQLITKIRDLRPQKSFITLAPGADVIKLFARYLLIYVISLIVCQIRLEKLAMDKHYIITKISNLHKKVL